MKTPKLEKLKRYMFLFATCMLSFSVMAQQSRSVSGTVKDENGEPLIGASVNVKGYSTRVITNLNGAFTTTVPQGENVLAVSYLGFASQEIDIAGKTVISVILKEDNNLLEDVVVVGYGVQRKKDLTGAVANIKAGQIMAMPVVQAAEALQGRVAGLDVTRGNGDAGEGVTIRLRGNRSVSTDKRTCCGIGCDAWKRRRRRRSYHSFARKPFCFNR